MNSKRVEIGFDGGQVIALRVPTEELDKLRTALGGGGWHQVSTAEETTDIDLGRVVFLRAPGDAQTVGFGSA